MILSNVPAAGLDHFLHSIYILSFRLYVFIKFSAHNAELNRAFV